MKVNDKVRLVNNKSKTGKIISVEPMLQVEFEDGEKCWHKEEELNKWIEYTIGTWINSTRGYVGLIIDYDQNKRLYKVVWFILRDTTECFHKELTFHASLYEHYSLIESLDIIPKPIVK